MTKRTLALLALAATLAVPACRKSTQVKGVDLTVTFGEKELTDNLITDVRYAFKTGSDFARLGRDLNVYVHFWHGTNLLLQDDFVPEPPTSAWEAGREYAVSRRIHIPAFIDEFDPQFKGEETLRLEVGFDSPYDRSGQSRVKVLERKLKVVPPPPDTPEIVYEEGWWDAESNPDAVLKSWRWTAKEARCLVDNPHRDALLVVRGGVNPEATPDQKVQILIDGAVLDEFPAGPLFEKSYTVPKERLGDKNEFTLAIRSEKTFVPADLAPGSTDKRECSRAKA